MKKYVIDHKNFSFKLNFPRSIYYLKGNPYIICKTNLDSLFARVVYKKISDVVVNHRIVKLSETPHYQYLSGIKDPYIRYLEIFGRNVGFGIEHSQKNFTKLLQSNFDYLSNNNLSNFIVCEKIYTLFGKRSVILDGVHRACLLLFLGYKTIPVAFMLKNTPRPLAQLDQYLKDYRDDFLEWYTPIKIAGRTIHERTYPDFRERKNFFSNKERGKSKWDYIIKKNLPSLKGKTVCDIGCNNGLYSIFMAQMGVKKVDGFDRGEDVIQPTNKKLPRQNVIQQAYFVRNLFILAGKKNLQRINYFECDINKMDFSTLKYDLFFSCCVLYHFGEKRFEEIIKDISENIPEVFLQTNLGHEGKLAKLASVLYQKKLLEKYGYKVIVDSPKDYNYAILYGSKYI